METPELVWVQESGWGIGACIGRGVKGGMEVAGCSGVLECVRRKVGEEGMVHEWSERCSGVGMVLKNGMEEERGLVVQWILVTGS